jgi:hypothetical protein
MCDQCELIAQQAIAPTPIVPMTAAARVIQVERSVANFTHSESMTLRWVTGATTDVRVGVSGLR